MSTRASNYKLRLYLTMQTTRSTIANGQHDNARQDQAGAMSR
jgi:hypothetical protein